MKRTVKRLGNDELPQAPSGCFSVGSAGKAGRRFTFLAVVEGRLFVFPIISVFYSLLRLIRDLSFNDNNLYNRRR